MDNFVITIARQYGSGGRTVGGSNSCIRRGYSI